MSKPIFIITSTKLKLKERETLVEILSELDLNRYKDVLSSQRIMKNLTQDSRQILIKFIAYFSKQEQELQGYKSEVLQLKQDNQSLNEFIVYQQMDFFHRQDQSMKLMLFKQGKLRINDRLLSKDRSLIEEWQELEFDRMLMERQQKQQQQEEEVNLHFCQECNRKLTNEKEKLKIEDFPKQNNNMSVILDDSFFEIDVEYEKEQQRQKNAEQTLSEPETGKIQIKDKIIREFMIFGCDCGRENFTDDQHCLNRIIETYEADLQEYMAQNRELKAYQKYLNDKIQMMKEAFDQIISIISLSIANENPQKMQKENKFVKKSQTKLRQVQDIARSVMRQMNESESSEQSMRKAIKSSSQSQSDKSDLIRSKCISGFGQVCQLTYKRRINQKQIMIRCIKSSCIVI